MPRGEELANIIRGLEGEATRVIAARVLAEAPSLPAERIDTPISLISGDQDRVFPVQWMRATAARYRAPWTRLEAGHNLPIAPGVAGPLLVGLVG